MSVTQTTDSNPEKATSYRWVVMVMWMFSHMWAFMVVESFGIFLPGMREDLGLHPIQEGWLGAAPQVGNLVMAIPSGVFLSRFSPKPLTTVTMVLGTLTMFFMGWAPGFFILLLGRIFYGLTIAAREPARTLLIRQWIEPREIVIANSTVELLWGLGSGMLILFPVILKLLDDSWRNTFYLFGGVSLLITLAWQFIGKERVTGDYVSEVRSQARSPIRSLLRYRELWLIALATFGDGVSFSSMSTFWPSLMLDNYSVSLTSSVTIRAIGGFVAAPAALTLGILISRFGKKKLLLIIGGIMMSFSNVGMLYTGSFFYLSLISITNGLSITVFPIFQTIPFELPGIRPREIVVATAFIRTTLMAGAIAGPVLAGALHQATGDLRLALTVTSSMALTISVCGILLSSKWNQPANIQTVPADSSVKEEEAIR